LFIYANIPMAFRARKLLFVTRSGAVYEYQNFNYPRPIIFASMN
jgi:hypothetical protein